MYTSMSFEMIASLPSTSILSSSRHLKSKNYFKYHLISIILCINIFVVPLVNCDDEIVASIQPFPQKRAGGKVILRIKLLCFFVLLNVYRIN